MRRVLVPFLLFSLLLAGFQSARAQSVVTVTDPAFSYRFGQEVNVRAKLTAPVGISAATILFRAEGEASTRSDPVAVAPDGSVNYVYKFAQGPLRSFARVDFWFHVTLESGEQVDTSPFYFNYDDDRFPWQTLEDSGIRVHWYVGDEAFARQALDAARAGLQQMSGTLSVTPAYPINLYIYAISADLQTALEIGGETWSNGHASPDLGVALVAITPGLDQSVEMERAIPHELAHLLTYQLAGSQYNNLPVWLREGIASMAESPNPDYPRAIATAAGEQTLIPIADLCGSFPPDLSRVTLAYAESQAFTRFLVDKYGNSGLVALIHAYADGLGCAQGSAQALGRPLAELETDWLHSATGGVDYGTAALQSLFPYLAILAVIIIVPLVFVAAIWRMPHAPK
jgi:hypothetical protein